MSPILIGFLEHVFSRVFLEFYVYSVACVGDQKKGLFCYDVSSHNYHHPHLLLLLRSVPVVVGPPNIEEFAPASDSFLHIKSMEDVEPVAKRMKYLAANPAAYNQTLRWKYEGPSDSFKALVDMAAVHSSCRLCIFLATRVREQEEKSPNFKKRPCKCSRGGSDIVYHVFVRERGRFEMVSIFLRVKV
ncbi:Glycosyl transferase family 10 [Arabidopsis thaliana x Arabidopsis arenosa]|uniref:Fucosyltransferase n=1 Tax=Arabidopsis thaliana x Arabidopsis arenosa TaxID=1240361 RepID=A0A8T2C5P7_9BRAS|nr:Glycosyl transferase family 10 [Arabidopsis thaliana x Arabidopsis arenosa]